MAARALAAAGHDVVVLEEHPRDRCSRSLHRPARHSTRSTSSTFPATPSSRTTHARAVRRRRRHLGLHRRRARTRRRRGSRRVRPGARRRRAARAGAELRHGLARAHDRDWIRSASRSPANGAEPIATRARACSRAAPATGSTVQLGLGVPRAFVQSAQLERRSPAPSTSRSTSDAAWRPAGSPGWCRSTRDGRLQPPRPDVRVSARLARFREFASRDPRALRRADATVARAAHEDPAARPRDQDLRRSRLLAVGDAAGLVKPTTGGGIYYSLISGQIAAECSTRRCALTICANRGCAGTRPAGATRLGADIRDRPRVPHARLPPERSRDRCARRARAHRRHRAAAATDRRLQLAPPVRAGAPPSRAVPPDPSRSLWS